MRSKHFFIVCLLTTVISLHSQTVEQIKANREQYLWGEGTGITLERADQAALSMLINQISTHVESKFTLLREEL